MSFSYKPYSCNDKQVRKHFACCTAAHFDNLNTLSNRFKTDHKDYLPVDEPQSQSLSSGSVSSCGNINTPFSSNTLRSDDQYNITATISMNNHQDKDSTEVGIKRSHDEALLLNAVLFETPQGDRLTLMYLKRCTKCKFH